MQSPRSLLAAAALAALMISSVPPAAAGGIPGFIYCLSNNGSTNEWNFLAADLDTFEVMPRGGPIADAESLGQAALVAGGTFFSMLLVRNPSDPAKDAVVLAGIDTASGARVASFDTRQWPGAAGRGVFIEALFASSARAGALFVVGRNLGQPEQLLLDVDASTGAATLRGTVNCSGGDLTWDESRELLFETVTDGNDEDSGSMVLVNTSAAASPADRVVGSFALADHFGFSLFDASTDSIFGLTLETGGPNGYTRNFVQQPAGIPSYNATSRGDLGALYVVLEDGPKALDAATRRAFFMLASGPFAEFEIVSVDVDARPVKILETPGLCGFIGYCPEAFAYGPAS